MRDNALSTPDSSTMAMTIGVPISRAFRSAAAMTKCAASLVTLCFGNTFFILVYSCLVAESERGPNRCSRSRISGMAEEIDELVECRHPAHRGGGRTLPPDDLQYSTNGLRRHQQRRNGEDHDTARSSVRSIPSAARASVRAMIAKSRELRAATAARTFPAI